MLSKHHKCNVCWHVVIYWGQKFVIYRLFELIFNDLFAIFLYDQLFSHLFFRGGLPRQNAPATEVLSDLQGLCARLPQTAGNLWGEKPQPSWQISTPSVPSTEAFPQVWGLLTLNAGLLWHSSAPHWDQDTAPESSLCSITSHISLQWREADWNDSCNCVCENHVSADHHLLPSHSCFFCPQLDELKTSAVYLALAWYF